MSGSRINLCTMNPQFFRSDETLGRLLYLLFASIGWHTRVESKKCLDYLFKKNFKNYRTSVIEFYRIYNSPEINLKSLNSN